MQCGNEIYISLDLSFSCVDRTGRTARSTFFSMEILMSRPFCRQNRLSILATPTTTPTTPPTTDWSSGCHFRRVCRSGSGHVFSSNSLRISVVPHKFVSDLRPAVGARDVIFGRPWGPGWATFRNPDLCGAVQCSTV